MRHAFLAVLIHTLCCVAAEELPHIQVMDGFTIQRAAGDPQIKFPMFAVFDDGGRLYVAESSGEDLYRELQQQTRKCRISRLEDVDGDGIFDRATVFAENLVFPMGLAWRAGKLYVADPPDLVAYEDRDDDGRAENRTVVLSGFGHSDNGSLHGLVFGPDHRLYMTMGEPDGYRLKLPGGKELRGNTGALIRCRPDGTDPEVVCRGFVNLVEVCFNPRGDIFGSDNWWQLPAGGVRDALVHCVEGAYYPYGVEKSMPFPKTGERLTAMNQMPAVAASGVAHYRGGTFPAGMRGSIFCAQHNTRKVTRHTLESQGSTFVTKDSEFLSSTDPDFHPSDVIEDADGSLLVVDTGGWYVQHCPTGKVNASMKPGGIYRVRYNAGKPPADPRGVKEDWAAPPLDKLAARLSDARPAVAERAAEMLSRRGDNALEFLSQKLQSNDSGSLRAVWVMSAIDTPTASAALRNALKRPVIDVRIAASRAIGLRRDVSALPELHTLLADDEPAVRASAAIAIARCASADSAIALIAALAAAPAGDRFLEHSIIYALHFCATQAQLESALNHASPRVQRAALILLDQAPRTGAPREAVLERLRSGDAALRGSALEILSKHPDWSAQAEAILRDLFAKPEFIPSDAQTARTLALAFQDRPSIQKLVGEAVERAQSPAPLRALALEIIEQSTVFPLPPVWESALGSALQDLSLRTAALRVLAIKPAKAFHERLKELSADKAQEIPVRLAAARAAIVLDSRLPDECVELLCTLLKKDADPLLRLSAAETLGRAQIQPERVARVLDEVQNNVLVSPSVLLPVLKKALTETNAERIQQYLTSAMNLGWQPSETELRDWLEALPAAYKSGAEKLIETLRQRNEGARERLKAYEPVLNGGTAARGREIFFGKKVGCSVCHSVGTDGGKVGPDLTRIGAIRSGRDLLESIVLPSATFAQGFDNYLAVLADGRRLTGVIAKQNADVIVLRDSSGADTQLRSDQVKTLKRLPVSLMPEGLPSQISENEFRDLMAFLMNLK